MSIIGGGLRIGNKGQGKGKGPTMNGMWWKDAKDHKKYNKLMRRKSGKEKQKQGLLLRE